MNAAAHAMRNGMFRVIALLALTAMTSIAAQPAGAREEPVEGGPAVVDPTSCGHFETQADATEALHAGELPDAENLDPDGDGIACEMRWPVDPDSPPAVYEPTSCGHFATQASAQAAFDSGTLPDPENLDADGDGIACEFRWGEIEGGPVVVERTSCGHYATQEDAQEAFDSGTLPDPQNLDADGDGIVCEFRWGEVEPDDSGAPTGGTETESVVVALPATGTGAAAAGGQGAMLIGILALVSGAGALTFHRRQVRAQLT